MRVPYHAVIEVDRFEQRTADPLDHRSHNLIPESVRVDRGPIVERRDGANNTRLAVLYGNLGERREVAAFFEPTTHPASAPALMPPEPRGGSREDIVQSRVHDVLEAKLQRIHR